jgi:hypothetical protein
MIFDQIATGRAELGDLFEQRRAGHEEEAQPRRERVDLEPGRLRGAHVGLAVRERERDLLRGRRPGLGHVVARDRDRVPLRNRPWSSRRRCPVISRSDWAGG